MLTIKKPGAPLAALAIVTILVPLLFSGCADTGPRALLQGDRLLREAKYARAIEKLERAAHLLPKEARAWNHLGLAYHGAGRLPDAVKAYQQALALDRNLAAAHYNLGCLQLEENNTAAAVAELISYTGLQPSVPDGWTRLGIAQWRARQTDAAEKSFRQALKLNPRSADAWNGLGLVQVQRRRYPEACQQFDTAQRARPDFAPALLNAAIVSYQYLNGRAIALQRFRQYLALEPVSPAAAGVQQIVNQLEFDLHPPAHLPPANPPPQLASLPQTPAPAPPANQAAPATVTNKSPVFSESQSAATPPPRSGPATSAPATRVSVASPSPPARLETPLASLPKLEVVRLTDEEPIKAARDINQTAATHSSLSTAAGSAARDTAAEANKTAALAKAGEPAAVPKSILPRYRYRSPAPPRSGNRGDAERLLKRGVQAQEGNRLSEAIDDYRQASQADPSFFDAHYNLGVAAFESGDWAICLPAYEYALAINPRSVKARFNFAVGLEKANYPHDAANELEKLLAENSSEARAHLVLANLYAQQLDDPAKAREHYLRLLELEPQHPQATAVRYWLEAHR
jgi:tetratricopeptide (TPR) repeat protein